MRRVSIPITVWVVGVALAIGCDEPDPEPDPYSERVRADVEACQDALDELAVCGSDPDCQPSADPTTAPFSLRVVIGCAAAACAGLSGAEADQCRYDAMVVPGSACAEARELCRAGGDASTWLE